MAKDDKGATEIGVHYFDIQNLSLINISLPNQVELYQNYPNPFNPVTTLRYDLAQRANVLLTVYDIMGKQVRTFDRGEENPGIKSIVWDGADDFGNPVSAGIYLFQIQTGDFTQTSKMILLK